MMLRMGNNSSGKHVEIVGLYVWGRNLLAHIQAGFGFVWPSHRHNKFPRLHFRVQCRKAIETTPIAAVSWVTRMGGIGDDQRARLGNL